MADLFRRRGRNWRRPAPVSRMWPRFLLGGLLLAVIVLVVGALAVTTPSDSAGPAGAGDNIGVPAPFETASPAATAAAQPIPVPARLLLALSSTAAWRAPTGSCPGTPITLEYTTDGGATWKPSTSAGALGATSVLDLERGASGAVIAIGQVPDDCAPRELTTVNRADKWKPNPTPLGAWYVAPGSPASVTSPTGVIAAPCPAVADVRAGVEQNVAVLCTDERLYRSKDAGVTWDTGIWVPGARALGSNRQGYLVAAMGTPMCGGVVLEVFSPSMAPRDRTVVGCHETDADPAATPVSISVAADAVWLWVGDQIVALTRNGATWA
ncbi:MAG TPA: hypothetical protein VEX88_14640 [Glaciibacter sp.]|nr:hypothetical protein [Glaciibacter sp.]